MLPFRSGRTEFSGASAAFLLLALLSCAVLAGDKTPNPEGEAKSSPKSPSEPATGITNIPIAPGHDAKGLVLPDFDRNGRLRGKLEAGVTRRLDDDHIEFRDVKFTTFVPETETPDLEVIMSSSVLNLKTQVLNSSERTIVKRADFEITGDRMQFETVTRKGTLDGNVKMVVRGKVHPSGNEGE